MAKGTCKLDGCERPRYCHHGWCKGHYQRWKRNGDLGSPEIVWKRRDPDCTIEGCGGKQMARGWCQKHYLRWRRTGHPEMLKQRGWSFRDGYVVLHEGGQSILEHRRVMENVLGRTLLPEETVHHKNGIRRDNRPENLELWVGWGKQPKGQRVADLLAFVAEHYPTEIAALLRKNARSSSNPTPSEQPMLW